MNAAIRRPQSLEETAAESQSYDEFGHNLKDFLHEVTTARKREQPVAPMFLTEPPRLAERFKEGNICDAFLAGIADYFSRVNAIPTPEWALGENRILREPWFAVDFIEVRALLLRDTPSAFKDKNMFIFESALRTG